MGVFHVMGLGMSPGAVTSVLHYLRDRLQQSQQAGTDFFGQSGEWNQRGSTGELPDRPPGYVQGLVLLTTPELSSGKISVTYEEGGKKKQGPALDVVKKELRAMHDDLTCKRGATIEFLVAEIPFRNFEIAFERSLAVLKALHPPARTGKEVWVNLTAGDNTLILALHVASALTGAVGRLYCINVPKDIEQRLTHPVQARHLGMPQNDTFWIDLPVLAVQDQQVRSLVLSILEECSDPLEDKIVLAQLNQRWPHAEPLPALEQFRRQYLHAMQAQKLIDRVGEHTVKLGPLGKRVRWYFERAREEIGTTSLRQLESSFPDWAHWEEI